MDSGLSWNPKPKTLALSQFITTNQSPIQFTPRQVLMAMGSRTKKEKEKKEKKSSKKGSAEDLDGSKEIVLDGGDLSARGKGREILLRSIAGFLETNGFKKTLTVFQSEAQIEENSWKSPVANLDDLFAKFIDSRDALALPALDGQKPQDAIKETEKKKRKKSTGNADEAQMIDETTHEKSKLVEEEEQKETKEKRKKKKPNEELKPVEDEREGPNEEKKEKKGKEKGSHPSENGNVKTEENDKNKGKEEKKKKKKEIKEGKETREMKEKENVTLGESKEPDEEKKEKRKRKKESEVGKEMQEKEKEKVTIEETNVENGVKAVSKKRKKGEEENVENDGKKRKLEQTNGTTKTSPEVENGSKNSEVDLKEAKSGKKEKESAEPKSANAFQRVKVEAVKFADERLQDNSYWAKDSAGSGYGAKAQEILEQVRGRNFRHEKTKKKRGTYRGGQIDLQSHSVKFNYSDEE